MHSHSPDPRRCQPRSTNAIDKRKLYQLYCLGLFFSGGLQWWFTGTSKTLLFRMLNSSIMFLYQNLNFLFSYLQGVIPPLSVACDFRKLVGIISHLFKLYTRLQQGHFKFSNAWHLLEGGANWKKYAIFLLYLCYTASLNKFWDPFTLLQKLIDF